MEISKLVNKAMAIACSCRTLDQLSVAQTYSHRVYTLIGKSDMSSGERLRSLCLIERSIGFAQGRISCQ